MLVSVHSFFPQECPENPECTVFQDCAVCSIRPDGRNCSNVNCNVSMVEGGVNTATYLIEGSKHKFVNNAE